MNEKIYNALFKTYENASELYKDGEILLNNGRKERAYTLFHFSFEESGRFFILAKVFFECLFNKVDARRVTYKYLKNKGYESHQDKLEESILKLFALPIFNSTYDKETEFTKDMKKMYEELSQKVPEFNARKNDSIYIRYINNSFISPSEQITEEHLEEMMQLAKLQILNVDKIIQSLNREGDFSDIKSKFSSLS